MKPHIRALLLISLTVAPGVALAASKAHEHGAVRLDVAVEGGTFSVAMEAPLDNLLGFERAPRTDAERGAAADLMARLRDGGLLFKTDAAAQCKLAKTTVRAAVLEPASQQSAKGAHAELDATYEYRCARPGELRTLEVGLFDAFNRVQRIDVQVAGPQGQSKAMLRRPARTIKLGR